MRSVVLRQVANRQTDRQTDKQTPGGKHNLCSGGNNYGASNITS